MRFTNVAAAICVVAAVPLGSTTALALPTPSATKPKTDVLNNKLNARLTAVENKLSAAVKAKQVAPAQASQMHKKLASIRYDSSKLVKQQGFLSAGEAASYNRTLDAMEGKLGK